ncbi:hypothetical protein [Clostridium tagluense]|uniref:PARP catalytic domain-containing protein n=1 Tax=Clostridium tagluense TaxID=360422 RepID=A0A401UQG5_9CLOT|nr:hypothetical protein [Clostridium tagluense]GCD11760.1 hypothetical protein Ctaglu_33830 [Clostridium tagluense]
MEDKKYLYLVKVEPHANNNKYYKMIQLDDNNFQVEYGRIACASPAKRIYEMSDWDSKLKEKIEKKHYVDQTRLVAEIRVTGKTNEYIEIKDASIRNIVLRLQQMARQAIKDNYTITSESVTKVMINEAQLMLDKLIHSNKMDIFNKLLVELFQIIPRKMARVSDYLAHNNNDFTIIMEREQDLLDVMEGQVKQQELVQDTNISVEELPSQTILEVMGLKIENITEKDERIIKSNLADIANRFCQGWKITNLRTQKKYDKFIQENKIKDNRLLFHGSRNENFWSIINNGLILRPSAIITGKMFGYGIYFAPNPKKSLGYTSIEGSYWSNGNSKSAFMGLFDVAYGKPYDVYSFEHDYNSLTYEKLQNKCSGANSLHAHKDKGMLRNDEIVVYREEQLTIKYLIELK